MPLSATAVEGKNNQYQFTLPGEDVLGNEQLEIVIRLRGDLNNNGVIDTFDVSMLKSLSLNKSVMISDIAEKLIQIYDMNNSGTVDQFDVSLIKSLSLQKNVNVLW